MRRLLHACIILFGATAIRHADKLGFFADIAVTFLGVGAIIVGGVILYDLGTERDQ